MRSKGLALMALAGLLQGCQQSARPASTSRLYAADQAGASKNCNVPAVTPPAAGKDATASITMGNDGGWCAITVANSGRPYAAGLLSGRPAHGRVFIHTVGDATRIDYTPNPGFAGEDSFMVRLLPENGVIRATVAVTKQG